MPILVYQILYINLFISVVQASNFQLISIGMHLDNLIDFIPGHVL